ncbi:RNA dependent RNA polymerase-domain-containing protein [Lentinula edodes]|uniref:RNA dependent RNA polymerase-domain-containing protein n=1 Tax=Lentinula edodes TaxID=5353 RepID=UPI001E8CB74C|nr:RNA dependent RNA polymerase-domain-containing protein [Lentinula edodes]KAH7868663.1 RNA dependent RNA polymerase-domain-containing protein [Lentinula edodes]
MDVFMHNIDLSGTQLDVIKALAKKLHRPEYSPITPLNFHVRLFQPGRRGSWRRNSGCGLLSLPTVEIGEKFLREYGGEDSQPRERIIVIRAKRVFFKKSTKPLSISSGILHQIRTAPFLDPNKAHDIPTTRRRPGFRQRNPELPNSLRISRVQFGWDCRDQMFSVEWDHRCERKTTIKFDPPKQQVEICLEDPTFFLNPEYELNPFDDGEDLLILFKYSQISNVAINTYSITEPAVIFSLYTPPSFRRKLYNLVQNFPSHRLSSLPLKDPSGRDHDDVAPYTSLSVRLVFDTHDGPALFRRLAVERGNLKLPIEDFEYPVEHRLLFSQSALKSFRCWLPTLRFDIACQLDALLRGHCADPIELLALRPEINYLNNRADTKGERRQNFVALVFQDFGQKALDLYWNPGQDLEEHSLNVCFMQCIRTFDNPSQSLYRQRIDDGLFYCLHVQVTPSSVLITGPLPERSNRIVRSFRPNHRKYFIRVSFSDEGRLRLRYDREIDGNYYIAQRIAPFLIEGLRERNDTRPKKKLIIGGRPFYFLAYSQSALKEHAVWFMTPFKENGTLINVQKIIQSLGSFSGLAFDRRLMYCPARYAARISQAFTSTDPTTTEVEEIRQIPDIERVDSKGNRWVFTDGVGTMSPDLARKIYGEMNPRKKTLSDYPRALQIRYLGAKGMLSVDYKLTGMTIGLRPSMIKFIGAPSTKLEIAQVFDKPTPFYLNRPLIVLLEGLGVPFETFKYYQDLAVKEAHEAMHSLESASYFFQVQGIGGSFRLPTVMTLLSKIGYTMLKDDFFERVLDLGVKHVLRDLKYRARIPVPGAYNLVGIADINQELGPNEISVCIMEKNSGKLKYLSGPCLVSRSPSIHPGDIQLVNAIFPKATSALRRGPLPNTIVFSTTGDRPVPSALGGGDLDGDEYDIIPLDILPKFRISQSQIQKPSLYKPAVRRELIRHCTLLDVAEFVMQYILSDAIGQVALTWRVLADSSPRGILDNECLRLADLHSQAVDYPKTGNPVSFYSIPRKTMYNKRLPDWYAPESMEVIDEQKYYRSTRALGKLFRDIDLSSGSEISSSGHHTDLQEQEELSLDQLTTLMSTTSISGSEFGDILGVIESYVAQFIEGNEEHDNNSELHGMFVQYCADLQIICSMHNLNRSKSYLLSEEEAVAGTILYNAEVSTAVRNDHIRKLREETNILVKGVYDMLHGTHFTPEQYLVRAFCSFRLATVYVQRENPVYGAKSFWWVTLGNVFDAVGETSKKKKEAIQQQVARTR